MAGQPQRTFTLLKRWVTHVLFTWRSIAWIVSFPPDSHRETEIKNQKAKSSASQTCNPLRLLSIMRSMQISELTPGMGRASSLLKARNTQVSPLSATIKLMSRNYAGFVTRRKRIRVLAWSHGATYFKKLRVSRGSLNLYSFLYLKMAVF